MQNQSGGIIGMGHFAPDRIVPNIEIENDLGVEAGWIERRTGIKNRRYADKSQALSDIALPACQMAIEDAGIYKNEIGLTLLATSTPDHLLPPSAPLLNHKLGLDHAGGIDMAGACSGFLYALSLADAYSRIHGIKILVVAANILSRRINPDEKSSRVLFADAAGAVVVSPPTNQNEGVIAADLATDGAYYDLIKIPAGGSRQPFNAALPPSEILMTLTEGQTIFTQAVQEQVASAHRALEKHNTKIEEIDHWVPHQANIRIINAAAKELGLPADKALITLDEFGNSSAATIPFSLSKLKQERAYKKGDKVLFSAFGAGFVFGSLLYGF